jgi:hypothetical protein
MLAGQAVCRNTLAVPPQQERQMDLNLHSDSSNILHQILAASLVNAVYTRMLLYGNEPPDEPLAEASREVMSLWRGLVRALASAINLLTQTCRRVRYDMNALDVVVLRVGDVAQLPRCLHAGAEAAAAQKE